MPARLTSPRHQPPSSGRLRRARVRYNWADGKQTFALSAVELGALIDPPPEGIKDMFHDPNMGSRWASCCAAGQPSAQRSTALHGARVPRSLTRLRPVASAAARGR